MNSGALCIHPNRLFFYRFHAALAMRLLFSGGVSIKDLLSGISVPESEISKIKPGELP